MFNNQVLPADDELYTQALAGEGEFWDNFVARRLLRGELPGSIDWRLTFSQFRMEHNWGPFCLGFPGLNFRMREINYLLRRATHRSGMRVLDLGCGAGWLSLELARLGAYVTALDISPANLALGRYMAETNARNFPYLYQGFAGISCRLESFGAVEYNFADLNNVTLPHAEYDAVVVWDSLHHIADLESLLEQVRLSLKPGGLLLGVDHSLATPRTEAFNQAALPVLEDFYSWVTQANPEWLYARVNEVAVQHSWGALAVDYDTTPLPRFRPFLDMVLSEMLEVVRSSAERGATENASSAHTGSSAEEGRKHSNQEGESPFEDVSAERVKKVLLEQFHANHFKTISPFFTSDLQVPSARSEAERLFQHYLSAMMIDFGERSIERGAADGQWFVFELAPEPPASPRQADDILRRNEDARQAHINNLERVASLQLEDQAYIKTLEAELARKNIALAEMEARMLQREAETIVLPRPRLPWKGVKRET